MSSTEFAIWAGAEISRLRKSNEAMRRVLGRLLPDANDALLLEERRAALAATVADKEQGR